MSKMATRKAVGQLQSIINLLGNKGGVIETNDPNNWWPLDLEVLDIKGNKKEILIGVFSSINGDVIYDPSFTLLIEEDNNNTIISAEILECQETTVLGTTVVDGKDMLHGFGNVEKDPYGLEKRFSTFMDGMTNIGPYLTNYKSIKKY